MDEKMTEILNDLNEFHNNIVNLNNINDSFKQYIEAIAKEKEIIDANNKDTLDKIKYYQDNLDIQIDALKNSIVSFINSENQTISETYKSFLDKIEDDKKYLDECCTKYLASINEQDKLLKDNQELIKSDLQSSIDKLDGTIREQDQSVKDNQELIKSELTKYISDLQERLKQSLDGVNKLLVEVNQKYDQMIRIFSEMDMLNEFKKTRKQNKIIFALLGGVIVAIIVLLIIIILK